MAANDRYSWNKICLNQSKDWYLVDKNIIQTSYFLSTGNSKYQNNKVLFICYIHYKNAEKKGIIWYVNTDGLDV